MVITVHSDIVIAEYGYKVNGPNKFGIVPLGGGRPISGEAIKGNSVTKVRRSLVSEERQVFVNGRKSQLK